MDRKLLILALIAVVFTALALLLTPSCPSPPKALSKNWVFIKCEGDYAVYKVDEKPENVFENIGEYYGKIMYYGIVEENGDENVSFPEPVEGTKYSLVAKGMLYLLAGKNSTKVFVSRANTSESVHEFPWSERICPYLPFDTLTKAEVSDQNTHFCYMKVNSDYNSVYNFFTEKGKPLLLKNFFEYNSLTARLYPLGKITGLVFYKKG